MSTERSRIITNDIPSAFTIIARHDLPEYRSEGLWLAHDRTGAEVYHLFNGDKENLFSFSFRTPPPDSTGVPHILEHAVLAGSRRFPVKDPFVALLKGSMQTFLNAMTFPDKTVYPASSQVEKDLFNLMLVYGDAVFFPLLKEEIFKQEGHHLEPTKSNDPESGLKVVGVVYNEMKGNYSSPEAISGDWSMRSLFPDTPYGCDSGGDPRHIPELTYEQFVGFHQRYYHPSNCRIFLYGNIAPQTYLAFLEENFLGQFERHIVDSALPLQPRWSAPRRLEKTYPILEKDAVAKKSTITVNWLSAPVTDPIMTTAITILTEALVGNAGSPLRKALIDSKLGEDLAPATGLETEIKELAFTVGLRGTDPEQVEPCEQVIMNTLRALRDQGIPDDVLQAAIQRVEFRNREITGGRGPFGLKLMRKALRGWLHDVEPEITLEFNRWMKACKEKIAADRHFLPRLIDEQLLSNMHRSTLLLRPDPEQSKREEQQSAAWLNQKITQFSPQDTQHLLASVQELKRFQETPDPPELFRKIPFLTLADLPREVERIPYEESRIGTDVPLFRHNVFSNGVVYIDLIFDSSHLEEELSRMLPLLGSAVCESGLPGMHYSEVARRLSQYTGGFTGSGYASGEVGNPLGKQERVFFRLKVLREHLAPSLDLVKRLLVEADFTDLDRLKDLVLELRNSFKASLIPNGNQFVSMRAASRLSAAFIVEERWKGITQIDHLVRLSTDLDRNLPHISELLQTARAALFSCNNLLVNVTGEQGSLDEAARELSHMVEFLPIGANERPGYAPASRVSDSFAGEAESFAVPTNVGYVAKALRSARIGTAENGYEAVLSHLLRTGYLWERVRMRGGAYGAFAMPHGTEGVFVFSSYRDPNIVETIEAFRQSLQYAQEGVIDNDQIDKAIIGTVGQDERPLEPGEKGFVNLRRKLAGITDEVRQQRRDVILSVNREALAAAGAQLLAAFDAGPVAVLSNAKAIAEAGNAMKELKERMTEIAL